MLSVEVLKSDLLTARKARDRVAEAALKRAIGRIESAEAPPLSTVAGGPVEVERLPLTEGDVRACLQAEIDEALEAIGLYRAGGRVAEADRLESEMAVLERYVIT